MAEYTIAAIPTQYRGRMYRSRLEARWAAFFDRLGWTHEYEPFDLGKWSPDFLLPELDLLVEVKPITKWDRQVAERICYAAPRRWILLTSVAPELHAGSADLGWVCDPTGQFHHALLGWIKDPDKPVFRPNLPVPLPKEISLPEAIANVRWWGPGDVFGPIGNEISWYGKHTMRLWADASNAVQWEPEAR